MDQRIGRARSDGGFDVNEGGATTALVYGYRSPAGVLNAFGTTNPDSPGHWLKTEFLDKPDLDLYRLHFLLEDNTTLPEEYIRNIRREYSGVYFGAIGGAGALLAKCIKTCELIAYEDLGAEALRKLYVEDMPLVVIIDSQGNNLYETGRQAYLAKKG